MANLDPTTDWNEPIPPGDPPPEPPWQQPPEPEPPTPAPEPAPAPPPADVTGCGLPDPETWAGTYVNAAEVADLIDLGYPAGCVLAWQRAVNESLARRGVAPPSAQPDPPGGGGGEPEPPPVVAPPPATTPPGNLYCGLPDPETWTGTYINAAYVADLIDLGYPAGCVLDWQRAVNESLARRGVAPPSAHPEPLPGGGGGGGGGTGTTPGGPGFRGRTLPIEDGPPLGGGDRDLNAVVGSALKGSAFVTEARKSAIFYGIDPRASLANALAEGINGHYGDGGHAYGPWQIWATDGRLKSFAKMGTNSPVVNAWCWSADGIDYAHRSMVAAGAQGLAGHPAVETICRKFEQPGDPDGETAKRFGIYDQLLAKGEQVWNYVAGLAAGPVGGGGSDGGGATTPGTPGGGEVPASVEEAWRLLQQHYALDVLGYAGTIQDTRLGLSGAVN